MDVNLVLALKQAPIVKSVLINEDFEERGFSNFQSLGNILDAVNHARLSGVAQIVLEIAGGLQSDVAFLMISDFIRGLSLENEQFEFQSRYLSVDTFLRVDLVRTEKGNNRQEGRV